MNADLAYQGHSLDDRGALLCQLRVKGVLKGQPLGL